MADPTDPVVFRSVLGHHPTGVTAVAAVHEGRPVGMAVGSFVSLSLDPPLVAWMCGRDAYNWPAIAAAGCFCVNVLTTDQQDVSVLMASERDDQFGRLDWRPSPVTGSPIIAGSLAWVDCETAAVHDGGDHRIVVGRVLDLRAENTDAGPLLFHRGSYRGLAP